MITIIAIGKKHEDWIQSGVERYEKRLKRPFDIEWALLPHSSYENLRARQEESERIRKRLSVQSYVILLDEIGQQVGSAAFSKMLDTRFAHSNDVTIVIGGAYGVDETVQQRADFVLSLSKMVFPHQLVRLLLVEQVYRAQSIATGSKYHHE